MALLLPGEITGHDGHGRYFLAKRRWFFATLVIAYLMGAANTVLKERDWSIVREDLWIDAFLIGLFVLGGWSASRRVHLAIAIAIPIALIALLGIVLEAVGV